MRLLVKLEGRRLTRRRFVLATGGRKVTVITPPGFHSMKCIRLFLSHHGVERLIRRGDGDPLCQIVPLPAREMSNAPFDRAGRREAPGGDHQLISPEHQAGGT